MMNEYVVVGLFAGCGGLDLGFKMAGFDVKLAIEIDEDACATYELNNPETEVWCMDVADVTGEAIRRVVGNRKILLIGGSPCQSWSDFKNEHKGSKKGLEDKRGQLIFQYLRIAEELQPEMVVFENVAYMVSDRHLPAFQKFKSELGAKTGLQLNYEILNSVDYEVAQKRERVIMIGTKNGNPFPFIKKSNRTVTLREALKDVPHSDYFRLEPHDLAIMKQIGPGQCWNSLEPNVAYKAMGAKYKGICNDCRTSFEGRNTCPKCKSQNIRNGYGITSYYRRLSYDKPCFTVTTVSTTKVHGSLIHPELNRGLSTKECARVQSFPDDFEFVGDIFSVQKQIGNAVSPLMAKAIAQGIIEHLKQTSKEQTSLDLSKIDVSCLTELEKDFLITVKKKQLKKEPFPPKYYVYLKEIVQKATK